MFWLLRGEAPGPQLPCTGGPSRGIRREGRGGHPGCQEQAGETGMKWGLFPPGSTLADLPGVGATSPSFLREKEAGRQALGGGRRGTVAGQPPFPALVQIDSTGSSSLGWKQSCRENTCLAPEEHGLLAGVSGHHPPHVSAALCVSLAPPSRPLRVFPIPGTTGSGAPQGSAVQQPAPGPPDPTGSRARAVLCQHSTGPAFGKGNRPLHGCHTLPCPTGAQPPHHLPHTPQGHQWEKLSLI